MAGEVASSQLAVQPVGDIGRATVGWVRFRGGAGTNVADTITVNGTEVWTAFAGAPGANQYDQSSGSDAGCAAAFVTAINGDAASLVEALVVPAGGDTVALVPKVLGTNYSLAESTAGARSIVSAAAMVGNAAAADRSRVAGSYSIVAADVTGLDPAGENSEIPIACIPSTGTPTLLSAEVRDANGVFKSKATLGLRLAQVDGRWWALLLTEAGAGPAVLAATDVITFDVAVTA